MGETFSTHEYSTLEKAEQLLVMMQKDPDLVEYLKNPETRQEALNKVGLTESELRGLQEQANQLYGSLLMAGW